MPSLAVNNRTKPTPSQRSSLLEQRAHVALEWTTRNVLEVRRIYVDLIAAVDHLVAQIRSKHSLFRSLGGTWTPYARHKIATMVAARLYASGRFELARTRGHVSSRYPAQSPSANEPRTRQTTASARREQDQQCRNRREIQVTTLRPSVLVNCLQTLHRSISALKIS
ncbi:hypothetical protein BDV95DRAFT_310518 [Massariosphaeria phaeospora]|uniref:Uncharacterized protein n=1 Tax=Massariosphaeria phaeospora TaxID=100035 RepID=A0A7C8IEK8_9PLEO|nr:hypothetical protein BDV95DRAFT_310518 [Massariosphaeria phaeospora]